MVRLSDGVRLHAHPYPMDSGDFFFAAHVFSITVLKSGSRIEPTSKEKVKEELHGGFQGKMVGNGMKATFPLDALSPDSEVVVAYTGSGFAGKSLEEGTVRYRFEAKSLR